MIEYMVKPNPKEWWVFGRALALVGIIAVGIPDLAADESSEYVQPEPTPIEQPPEIAIDTQELLRQLEKEVEASSRQELREALRRYKSGQLQEAIAALERLLDRDPTVMTAWDLLGQAYWKAGRQEDSFRLWERLKIVRPDFFPLYNWIGRGHMLHGEYADAIEAFRTSLRLQPVQERDNTKLNLARLLRWSGHLEEAAAMLRSFHQAAPQRRDITRELASALISNRDYEEALPLWIELQANDPTNLLFLAKLALAQFHTGHVGEAVEQARRVLAEDSNNVDAIRIMADEAQFHGEHPEEALTWLSRLMYQTADAKTKRQLTLRYATLYERLHDSEPKRFSLNQPATVMGQLSEADPYDVDLALAHAELLLGDGRYDEARRQLTRVLKELNPNNTRAIKDLFNVALAERNFGEALEYYHRRVAFNPRDPFLHYWMAQWYAGQERYYHAYRELDQLESAGRRGAVAVLLYHGLSASPNGEVQPVARLRETLTAFQQAGFHFIAAHKLSAYFIKHAQLAETLGEGSLERVICVTFDDARRDTMRYATPVGQQLKLPFSMLVPVGFILKQHPFMCTWDMLRDYQRAGCWSFGGHTLYAHERVPIDAAQRMGFALPNHIWRPQEKRLETDAEYAARLTSEYDECHDLIVHNLDHAKECNYFAYPFGDIGQCTRSNDPDAPRKNLEHAAHYFAVGLIQTDRGYAMADDNPLLFQRYEPDRSDSAATVLEHVLVNHPVQVARRLRAQYAALEDKRYLLLRTLRAMQLDGYPEPALRELIADCERAMHRRIPLDEIEHVEPAVSTMVRPETNQPSVKPSEKPVAAVTPPSDETPAPRRPSGQRSTGDAFESAHPGLRDLHDPLK